MPRIHSHYDNLKVSRDAPPAVIRAAYRALSRQYHPDVSALPDAERIMAIVNRSYDVLSDPTQRAAHDAWLMSQERSDRAAEAAAHPLPEAPPAASAHWTVPEAGAPYLFWPLVGKLLRNIPWQLWLVTAMAVVVGFWPTTRHEADMPTWQAAGAAAPVTPEPAPVRYEPVAQATMGEAQALEAGYEDGRANGYAGGYSTVSIDNGGNDFSVAVKLVASFDPRGGAARVAHIPAHQSFTMTDIVAGDYEIRYMNLAGGSAFKSKPFSLTEESMADGVRYSQITMTLYTVQNGNTHMTPILAEQF